jgi:hypothetical protein
MTIGEKVSPVLEMTNSLLVEHMMLVGEKPGLTDEGIRAAFNIAMTCLLEKMFEIQESEKMPQEDREKMAVSCGEEFRKLIHTYTGFK